MGAGSALPVCWRVSSSNTSSSVPNPPGSDTKPCDSFTSMSLRVKKYFIDDELLVAGDDLVGAGLERQPDADADRLVAAGALHAGLHDPGPGAGDDHPALVGHGGGEVAGLLVERVARAACGPSRRSSPWARRWYGANIRNAAAHLPERRRS